MYYCVVSIQNALPVIIVIGLWQLLVYLDLPMFPCKNVSKCISCCKVLMVIMVSKQCTYITLVLIDLLGFEHSVFLEHTFFFDKY